MRSIMRIGIDARAIHLQGIGRYIRELIRHLARVDTRNQYIIYFPTVEHMDENKIDNPNFQCVLVPYQIYTVKEQLYLPYFLYKDKLDLFHSTTSLAIPLLRTCRHVITLHDLLLKIHPEFLPSKLSWVYFQITNWWAIKFADKIITISDFTSKELSALYPKSRHKITTIHNGVSAEFQVIKDKEVLENVKKKYGITKDYILYVGTYKENKNLPTLVKAYAQLPHHMRHSYYLVIVGKQSTRYPEVPALIKQLGIESTVICINHVREEDLPVFYSGATVFVFPSIYEGFGLPIIEAMACGAPVVASNQASIPEIATDAAILTDPLNVKGMSGAVYDVLSNPQLRKMLVEKGLERAKSFSWEKTARETMQLYCDVR